MVARATANSPWPAGRRRSAAKFDLKREAVVSAAAKLFCEQGYDRTSLNDLAEVLNITKPTVYYYFPGKDEILLEITRQAQERAIAFLERARYSDASGIDKLKRVLIDYAHLQMTDIGQCGMIYWEHRAQPARPTEVDGRVARAEEAIYAILEQAASEGDIELKDREVAYRTAFGALNWLPRWFKPTGKRSADAVAELQAEILINGLRVRSGKKAPTARSGKKKSRP